MTALSPQVHTLPLSDTMSYYSLPLTTHHAGAPPIIQCQIVGGREGRIRREVHFSRMEEHKTCNLLKIGGVKVDVINKQSVPFSLPSHLFPTVSVCNLLDFKLFK